MQEHLIDLQLGNLEFPIAKMSNFTHVKKFLLEFSEALTRCHQNKNFLVGKNLKRLNGDGIKKLQIPTRKMALDTNVFFDGRKCLKLNWLLFLSTLQLLPARSFLPLISALTGFCDWSSVTRWAQLLITSNYNLPITPKNQCTMRAALSEQLRIQVAGVIFGIQKVCSN